MGHDLTHRLQAAFAQRPAILDGGLGAELLSYDVDVERDMLGHERSGELLSVTRPELVRQVHASFKEAGAQFLTTNTFCADPASLATRGLSERSDELTRAAAAICRGVASHDVIVLGSVGPGPGKALPDASATRAFLECLVDAGVDGLLLETQVDGATLERLLEQALLVRAEHGGELFIAVSLVVDSSGRLAACRELDEHELLTRFEAAGVGLLTFNCSTGSAPLHPALARLRGQWSTRIGVYPNAGLPNRELDGELRYPIDPGQFATGVLALQREFGLDLVGGCCGASPAHIRALSV